MSRVILLSDIVICSVVLQLENLRNSSEFQKDKDEETKKRNTYNPDESKEKSNRRRERTAAAAASAKKCKSPY